MTKKLKKRWRKWRFDQMAVMINDRIDNPSEAGVDRYVGLEHLDSDSLTIRRWGSPSDVEATKLRFKAGDIIFGRRRVYQRKLGVPDFDGICSAHAMVLRARIDVVLPEFLPFFMQSGLFMERAKQISVGSLSPTINWKTLAAEEFALPPLDEQRRIAEVLGAVGAAEESCRTLVSRVFSVRRAMQNEMLFPSTTTSESISVLLSNIATINPSAPPLPENAPFVPMDCVNEWERDVARFEVRGNRGGVRAAAGDVLMARITPSLENGKIAQVPSHVVRCAGSTEFIVLRPKADTDSSYLYWLISSDRIRNTAVAMMSGTTGRQRVSGSDIAGIRVPFVGLAEQRRLGNLIDDIEVKRRMLKKRLDATRELRRILVNNLMRSFS